MKPPADIQEGFRRGLEEEVWHHSTPGKWMTQHYAEAEELLRHRGMNWTKAAAAFAAYGLRDRADKAPTAETARETWKRVEARRRAGMNLIARKWLLNSL